MPALHMPIEILLTRCALLGKLVAAPWIFTIPPCRAMRLVDMTVASTAESKSRITARHGAFVWEGVGLDVPTVMSSQISSLIVLFASDHLREKAFLGK